MLTIKTFTAIWEALCSNKTDRIKKLLNIAEKLETTIDETIDWQQLITTFLTKKGLSALDASINKGPYAGCTILWFAAFTNQWEFVRLLIAAGAHSFDAAMNKKNDEGCTVLSFAATYQKTDIIKLLLEKGASIQLDYNCSITPYELEQLARDNSKKSTPSSKILKAANKLFELCEHVPTTLKEIINLKENIIPILIRLGSGLNAQKKGKTALEVTIENRNTIAMNALLCAGASLSLNNQLLPAVQRSTLPTINAFTIAEELNYIIFQINTNKIIPNKPLYEHLAYKCIELSQIIFNGMLRENHKEKLCAKLCTLLTEPLIEKILTIEENFIEILLIHIKTNHIIYMKLNSFYAEYLLKHAPPSESDEDHSTRLRKAMVHAYDAKDDNLMRMTAHSLKLPYHPLSSCEDLFKQFIRTTEYASIDEQPKRKRQKDLLFINQGELRPYFISPEAQLFYETEKENNATSVNSSFSSAYSMPRKFK